MNPACREGVRMDIHEKQEPGTKSVLITGAAGEIGQGLIRGLRVHDDIRIVATDLKELPEETHGLCDEVHVGDVCDVGLMQQLITMHEVTEIYHLAALLSSRAEYVPEVAHEVNVGGTFNLLKLSASHSASWGRPVKFILPSTIAVYGMNNLDQKQSVGAVAEGDCNDPRTMYGCNKLYCELLGRYYSRHYRSLGEDRGTTMIDFRCLRLPGIIAAETKPTGGTSDYVPGMLHAAASGTPYVSFVREDTRIPWMTMPECIESMLQVGRVDAGRLNHCVYNVSSFSASAGEVADMVRSSFPGAQIEFMPDEDRQAIVDSWPEDVDVTLARNDWGFSPRWGLEEAFSQYIIPSIRTHYAQT